MTDFHKHPEYTAKQESWEQYRRLFIGEKQALLQKEFVIHEFEKTQGGKDLLDIRKLRTQYTNYMAPFVNRFVSLIFKKDQDYSGAMASVFAGDDGEAEFNDIDGMGTPLDLWLKREVAPLYFLYGKAGVFVDAPPGDVRTRAEQQAIGLRPYMHAWEPLSILDWQNSTDGGRINELDFATHTFKQVRERTDAVTEPMLDDWLRYLRLEDGRYVVSLYKQADAGFELVEEITPKPPLDIIPLAIVDRESWMKDVAPKLIQLFNLESTLDNIHLFQAHQRIIAVGDFKELGDEASIAASEGNLTVLNTRAGGSIQIAEPVNTQSIERRIEQVKMDALRIAFNQNRHLPGDSRAVEGANTLREQKEEFLALAINAAKDLEAIANESIYLFGRFKNIRNLQREGFVKFDTDITEEDLSDMVLMMQAFRDRIDKFPLWRKELDKAVARQGNFANIEEILEEIEAGTAEPVTQADPIEAILGNATGNTESSEG